MLVGLVVAVLFTYRRDRQYAEVSSDVVASGQVAEDDPDLAWSRHDVVVLLGLAVTLVLQIIYGSLVLAALAGIVVIFLLRAERWKDGEPILDRGVAMMGTIAFIMLIASGYAAVLTETGAVDGLVETTTDWFGDSGLWRR